MPAVCGHTRTATAPSPVTVPAIDMATKKYSTAQIMQEGIWKKPETVMRYIRHVDAHAGAMIDLMKQFD